MILLQEGIKLSDAIPTLLFWGIFLILHAVSNSFLQLQKGDKISFRAKRKEGK
jgi:hypothetical protein